jgi:CheY-like chemotaxis protein
MAAPLHILIVDDSADNAVMLHILLKQEGYTTRIASDGQAAVTAARTSPPHVILLDLGLPGMSGIELATELCAIPELSDCRLVAITGHGKETLPVPSPFDRYFQKPVATDALLDYLAGIRREGQETLAAVA